MVNRCANAANLLPPLGSPERGAVAARSGVTEGLVQRGCGHTSVIRKPRPGGRGSLPLRDAGRWVRRGDHSTDAGRGGWHADYSAARRPTAGECGGGVARGTGVAGHPTNGAPGTVRPTTRIVAFSNKPTPSVIQRKGRRGRRPLRWSRVGRFQRSREVQFFAPVTLYSASPVTLLLVGCTVLGAPRLRECRAGLGASVRPDRFYPC